MNPAILQAESPEQIATTRDLFKEYAASLGFDLCFQSFEKELAELPGDYAPPSGRLLLAVVDGVPAGCVGLHRLDENAAEMKRLYVRPEFRGHKLGQKLLGVLITQARKIGYRRLRLDTVEDKMRAAVALYRANGFHEI